MRSLTARPSRRTLARRSLLTGMFVLAVGCTQGEGGAPSASPSTPAPTMQDRAAASPTPMAVQPLRGNLATFAESLGRKLDRSHAPTPVALPEGGILNVPNGHVAHASVLVRGPDGRLRSACVSSPAEVSALVQQMNAGAGR
jgi:hypothetical protein